MTNSSNGREMTLAAAAAAPDRLGQATAVEQSRAIAEVQGAIVVAQQCPRDVQGAIASMRESARQRELAKRAFFKFPRGGSSIQGASVYLARELARCWGNIQYGVSELRRDDVHGQSEMQAYAWDVQTNSRVVTTFVVPHMRDKKDGPEKLTDMRDIYENNANAGARRVRECIFSILPPWYVEEAKKLCMRTLEDGGGVPLAQRIANLTAHYAQDGITLEQLEQKVGRPNPKWTTVDLAQLEITLASLRNGETTRELEFPPDATAITTKDIVGDRAPEKAAEPKPAPAEPPAPVEEHPAGESVSQQKHTDAGTVPTDQPAVSHLIDEKDLPKFFAETGLKREPDAAGKEMLDNAPADGEQLPSADGPKARRAQVNALVTLLKDKGAAEHKDHLAVVSMMLDQPIPALANLSADEVTYLYNQVDRRSHAEFAGMVDRARRIAAGG